MMPDLGTYAGAVTGAYAVSVGLIAALVAVSLWQGARMRRALRKVEARVNGTGTGVGRDE